MTFYILINKIFTLLAPRMIIIVGILLNLILCIKTLIRIKIQNIDICMLGQNLLWVTAQDRTLLSKIIFSKILDQWNYISITLKSINSLSVYSIKLISFCKIATHHLPHEKATILNFGNHDWVMQFYFFTDSIWSTF